MAAARVPVPATFWRRHIGKAAALNRFDGFARQARDGSVQLWLGHGTSFREIERRLVETLRLVVTCGVSALRATSRAGRVRAYQDIGFSIMKFWDFSCVEMPAPISFT
jgi:hypothetical protein